MSDAPHTSYMQALEGIKPFPVSPSRFDASTLLPRLDEQIIYGKRKSPFGNKFQVLCLVPLAAALDVYQMLYRESRKFGPFEMRFAVEGEGPANNEFKFRGISCQIVAAEVPDLQMFFGEPAPQS